MGACKNKTDTAALKKEVLTLHDQVMNEDGRAMNDKIALDTVGKKMPMPGDSAKILSAQLSKISDTMMDWMHQFDPDQKGKSDDQMFGYLKSQKTQLLKLDSTYKSLLKVSDSYLKKCNVKPGNIPRFLRAQDALLRDFHLSHTDSLAIRAKYEGNIVKLTTQLTAPCINEMSKARAIFLWITNNIEYDYKNLNRRAAKGEDAIIFDCPSDDSMTCIIKKKVWENGYITKALDKKKAICQGYAMLFKRMCDIAGLHAEVIPGYTRTEYYEVGTPGELDHAWNAIQLNGTYYLLDATWAAGYCTKDGDDKLTSFVKNFNPNYWLTPPEAFAKNHFPLDAKWVLLPKFTIASFSANPYYDPGDTYTFAYVVKSFTLEYLDIMFDRQRALRFKVTDR
eukprot:gene7109-7174_t